MTAFQNWLIIFVSVPQGQEPPRRSHSNLITLNFMLRHKLIHPQISSVLAAAGHHSTILIADGNYPAASKRGPRSELVSLNLMPGIPTCNQVLEAVLSAVPVEAIQTMQTETSGPYALDGDPPVWADYRETIKKENLDQTVEDDDLPF